MIGEVLPAPVLLVLEGQAAVLAALHLRLPSVTISGNRRKKVEKNSHIFDFSAYSLFNVSSCGAI